MSRASIRILMHLRNREMDKAHSKEMTAARLRLIEPDRAEVLSEQAAMHRITANALGEMLSQHPDVFVHPDPSQMVLFQEGETA